MARAPTLCAIQIKRGLELDVLLRRGFYPSCRSTVAPYFRDPRCYGAATAEAIIPSNSRHHLQSEMGNPGVKYVELGSVPDARLIEQPLDLFRRGRLSGGGWWRRRRAWRRLLLVKLPLLIDVRWRAATIVVIATTEAKVI
jgi:hypothetical protein